MKNRHSTLTAAGLTVALAGVLSGPLRAEPPGPPSDPPEDTMKSLQEIWDKLEALEAENVALDAMLDAILGIVTIEMVAVGNAGNDADTDGDPNPAGKVDYEYKIGKYEVTNAQYAAFLNAVAATDPNGLYNPNMAGARGGITRTGTSGSYTYAVKGFMGDKPVNYVSWYDALRFCNWLHNGQPKGLQDGSTTEGGAYTLTSETSVQAGDHPTHGANGRNTGARNWLPSEDEWYKAAYHEPGASVNGYWLYPTRSDSGPGPGGGPTVATADLFGNIDNDTPNIANYNGGADWNGQTGNVTTVGSGGPGSASFYGAFDMGGNVREWNEQLLVLIPLRRGLRGGSWINLAGLLQSSFRDFDFPTFGGSNDGFRVAGP